VRQKIDLTEVLAPIKEHAGLFNGAKWNGLGLFFTPNCALAQHNMAQAEFSAEAGKSKVAFACCSSAEAIHRGRSIVKVWRRGPEFGPGYTRAEIVDKPRQFKDW